MNALVIMAKEPQAGEVKTRLVPPLTPEMASKLYLNFLLDKIQQGNSIGNVQPWLAYHPASALDFFKAIVPPNFELIEQKGKDLGERLINVSSELLDSGHEKVIMIDSDSPNLPRSYIEDGIIRLSKNDVVIGPCEDGGYYLIGVKHKMPELFMDIPWSTSDVTRATLENARKIDVGVAMLEPWYDVDTFSDLERLKKDLEAASDNHHKETFCESTYRILNEIFNR